MDTKIPETDLNGAERKVLDAFRTHKPTVPVADAKIRGDFLRGLFLGEYDERADYRGTCIVGAVIDDEFNMGFCETKFPVRFHDCHFEQAIKFQQLTCPELDFSGCTLKNGFDARMVKVAGVVDLREVCAAYVVDFDGAEIGGQLNCSDGNFRPQNKNNKSKVALTAQSIKVTGDVFLNDGFNATGEVRLPGAKIGSQLVCSGGVFQNEDGIALNAMSIRVGGFVSLRDGFRAVGEVRLLDAEIGGELNCTGGNIRNEVDVALNARSIKVANEVIICDFSAIGRVSFLNATIGGILKLENCEMTYLYMAGANVLGEFRDDAGIYKDPNGNAIALDIDGFRYHRLNAAEERTKDRLAWVSSMSESDRFRPQPYEQLMKVYRETGHMNWAREAGFALENARHEKMKPGWWKKWYWLLRHTIGYGYNPFRSLTHWFLPLILAGLVLFSGMLPCSNSQRAGSWLCHCMAPSDAGVLLSDDWKVHGKLPKDYPDFNPVYYAVEAALPVLPLGQTENWHPKTWWARWLQGAITIIGALVLTILASYGVGVLGPRWKSE